MSVSVCMFALSTLRLTKFLLKNFTTTTTTTVCNAPSRSTFRERNRNDLHLHLHLARLSSCMRWISCIHSGLYPSLEIYKQNNKDVFLPIPFAGLTPQ